MRPEGSPIQHGGEEASEVAVASPAGLRKCLGEFTAGVSSAASLNGPEISWT